jgi:hypothetical protein
MSIELKPIANEVEFERFCCEVAKDVFGDFLASRYGRRGQRQCGIDIRAQDFVSQYGRVVIQCKFNQEPDAKALLKKAGSEFETDLTSAQTQLTGAHDFDTFVYAGLWPNDTTLKQLAEELAANAKKKVLIWSLETLKTDVQNRPRLQRLFARGYSGHGVLLLDRDFWDQARETEVEPLVYYAAQGSSTGGQQWVGLVHRLDAPRACVQAVEERLDVLVPRSANLESKVVAVVHGEGGSGKSTALRRIAFNRAQKALAGPNHEVCWWVTDLTQFVEHDAFSISDRPGQKHLVFVEDWYRNVGSQSAKAFFSWLSDQRHVLVLIGDRTVNGRAYMAHIYGVPRRAPASGHEGLFGLTPSENIQVLTHALTCLQGLKQPGAAALKTLLAGSPELLTKAPLFMSLYVVCHEAAQHVPTLDLADGVHTRFAQIITAKLFKIEESAHTKGLGRALWVQAAIYAAPKSEWQDFSESTLQLTARFFAGVGVASSHLSAFSEEQYPPLLAALAHRSRQSLHGFRVRFNHDLIAETGVSHLYQSTESRDSPEILSFTLNDLADLATLRALYAFLVEARDAPGALQLFCYLAHQGAFDKDRTQREMLNLVDLHLSEKIFPVIGALLSVCSNRVEQQALARSVLSDKARVLALGWAAPSLVRLVASEPFIKGFAREILAQGEFWTLTHAIISTALNILGPNDLVAKKAASKVLEQGEFWTLPDAIISNALKILGPNDSVAKKAASDVLEQSEFWTLPHAIISNALHILGPNDLVAKKAASKVLEQGEFWTLPYAIISNALHILGPNDSVAKKAASDVLEQVEFWTLPHAIISNALNILGPNDSVAKEAASDVLEQGEFWTLPSAIISTALNILGPNDLVAKKAASKVLEQGEFWTLPHAIISNALNILGPNDSVAKEAARKVLAQGEFWTLPKEIISNALNILGPNDSVAKKAARKVLAQGEFWALPHQIISNALNILGPNDPAARAAAAVILRMTGTLAGLPIFASAKILAQTQEPDERALLHGFLERLYRNAQATPVDIKLRYDLLYLPLFSSAHFVRFWQRQALSYRQSKTARSTRNTYQILHCQYLYGKQTPDIERTVVHLCQTISRLCVPDVLHQWLQYSNEMGLMHVALAFEILKRPSWQRTAVKNLQELANQHPKLAENDKFRNLLSVLKGEVDIRSLLVFT